MNRQFCIVWIKGACLATVLVGLVASAASTHMGSEPWRFLFDLLTWPLDQDPAAFSDETRAVNAVLGGVMVGWAVLMYAIVSGPVSRGDGTMLRPLILSIAVWFVVDSGGSFLAGIPGNVVLNISFLALFLVPLICLTRLD